jgi:hypothetical protein
MNLLMLTYKSIEFLVSCTSWACFGPNIANHVLSLTLTQVQLSGSVQPDNSNSNPIKLFNYFPTHKWGGCGDSFTLHRHMQRPDWLWPTHLAFPFWGGLL